MALRERVTGPAPPRPAVTSPPAVSPGGELAESESLLRRQDRCSRGSLLTAVSVRATAPKSKSTGADGQPDSAEPLRTAKVRAIALATRSSNSFFGRWSKTGMASVVLNPPFENTRFRRQSGLHLKAVEGAKGAARHGLISKSSSVLFHVLSNALRRMTRGLVICARRMQCSISVREKAWPATRYEQLL